MKFNKLEPGDGVDATHLADCASCRSRWQLVRFVRAALRVAPQADVPPFFASRVAALARSSTSTVSFFIHLQRAARTLVPVFMVLVIVATSALYMTTNRDNAAHYYSEVLFEQPAVNQDISLEFIATSLWEPSDEE